MQNDSVGRMLPQIVFPYLRQWAERSGMTALSKLLTDEQFVGLVAKYADEFIPPPSGPKKRANGNGQASRGNGQKANAQADYGGEDQDMEDLHARVLAMEAQQNLLDVLRIKIRPLALALGCCPECVVGLEQCPICFGQSRVAFARPDPNLLRTLVVQPLIASGVPLTLGEAQAVRSKRRPESDSIPKKRTKAWPKK